MKAIVYEEERLQCKDISLRPRSKDESTVAISLAGICHTDKALIAGYQNFEGTLGHEFVGLVVDSEDKALLGKRVVSDINIACMACERCKEGHYHHCQHRRTIGIHGFEGAFAEKIHIPNRNLVPVPDRVPDEVAVFAEPFAAALAILDQVHIRSADEVAVFGDGKLGQMIVRALSLTGASVVMVGKHPEKLKKAARFSKTLTLSQIDTKSRYDVVVDATGREAGFQMARKHLKPGGKLVLKTTGPFATSIHLSEIVVSEQTIVGSRCGNIEAAIRVMGCFDFEFPSLIEGVFSLCEFEKAFNFQGMKGIFKI